MDVLERLREAATKILRHFEPPEDDAEASMVGARIRPRPTSGAAAIALREPD